MCNIQVPTTQRLIANSEADVSQKPQDRSQVYTRNSEAKMPLKQSILN